MKGTTNYNAKKLLYCFPSSLLPLFFLFSFTPVTLVFSLQFFHVRAVTFRAPCVEVAVFIVAHTQQYRTTKQANHIKFNMKRGVKVI